MIFIQAKNTETIKWYNKSDKLLSEKTPGHCVIAPLWEKIVVLACFVRKKYKFDCECKQLVSTDDNYEFMINVVMWTKLLTCFE